MSVKSQQANMKNIFKLVSQDLGYIHGERESGPNGAKKLFHTKSAAFLRTLGNDLGLKEFKVHKNVGGIAVAGEITLMGLWADGNGVYFQISQSLPGCNDFLYRHITHMKDYSSGANQWLDYELFKIEDYSAVIDTLSALRKSSETSETVNRYAA
jgi:hypothetical protein